MSKKDKLSKVISNKDKFDKDLDYLLQIEGEKLGFLGKYKLFFKEFTEMLGDYRKKKYRNVSKLTFFAIIFMPIYLFSPVDIIPDWFLGFGQLDDLSILLIAFKQINKDTAKYIFWKYKESDIFDNIEK
ncbi:MAG: YkvA family protein [Lachnospirales bacterium]